MNRFKREIRRKGIRLECDYEYLPYNSIETVVVNAEDATIRTYHNCAGWSGTKLARTGDLLDMDAAETLTNFWGDELTIYPTWDGAAVVEYWYLPGQKYQQRISSTDRARDFAYRLGFRD